MQSCFLTGFSRIYHEKRKNREGRGKNREGRGTCPSQFLATYMEKRPYLCFFLICYLSPWSALSAYLFTYLGLSATPSDTQDFSWFYSHELVLEVFSKSQGR